MEPSFRPTSRNPDTVPAEAGNQDQMPDSPGSSTGRPEFGARSSCRYPDIVHAEKELRE